MTDSIRQARARARRTQAGLVRLEFWVPAERRDEIRALVAGLLKDEPPALGAERPPLPGERADRRRDRLRAALAAELD